MRINIIILLFCGFICSGLQAQISPEAGSGRMWPGSNRSGLLRSPSPVNLQGNNLVTGNVVSGRDFRGNVNYTSPYDFRAPAGSTQLDSFLRRTSGSVITQTPGTYTPYYNRLSSYNPRSSRLANPSLANVAGLSRLRVNDRAASTSVPSTIRNEIDVYRYFGGSRRVSDTTSTYFSNQLRHKQRSIAPQVSQYLISGEQLTDEQRQILDQQLSVDPQSINDEAPSLKYKKFNDDKSLQSYLRNNLENDYLQKMQTQKENRQIESDESKKVGDKIEQKMQLFEKQIEELSQQEIAERTKRLQQSQRDQQSGQLLGNQQDRQEQLQRDLLAEGSGRDNRQQDIESQEPQKDVIDELGLSLYRTESVVGTDQKLSQYMELRSEQLTLEGDEWLSKKKFYRASDAYTTSLIFEENALAYAGKCHALFGAGEYMSSSYFLFLAIEMDPGYIDKEIDIVSAMGGRDVLESRLADVDKWAQESNYPDLHFLRAYFYYRIGRIEVAKEAINLAYEQLPDSSVVTALKAVVDKKAE
jgi:hypothetical protein